MGHLCPHGVGEGGPPRLPQPPLGCPAALPPATTHSPNRGAPSWTSRPVSWRGQQSPAAREVDSCPMASAPRQLVGRAAPHGPGPGRQPSLVLGLRHPSPPRIPSSPCPAWSSCQQWAPSPGPTAHLSPGPVGTGPHLQGSELRPRKAEGEGLPGHGPSGGGQGWSGLDRELEKVALFRHRWEEEAGWGPEGRGPSWALEPPRCCGSADICLLPWPPTYRPRDRSRAPAGLHWVLLLRVDASGAAPGSDGAVTSGGFKSPSFLQWALSPPPRGSDQQGRAAVAHLLYVAGTVHGPWRSGSGQRV